VNVMEETLPKLYDPKSVEEKWQRYWLSEEVYKQVYRFDKDSNKPPFVIDTPPPFTSGELHMGHAYWNILNDVIARYKRMRGFNVLLPQGWDCQGLPTELKVQHVWKIPKDDPERFRAKCVEWTELMISKMKEMMIKLGYRPDWEQFEYRTMDKWYWACVQKTLLNLFKRGLIYQKEFPVHWCPKCGTALAQAELGYVEKEGLLYYVVFQVEDKRVEVATTRPELIPACQALAYNPGDERYAWLVGKKAKIPIFEREVPILQDDAVDPSFGTGLVMICTYGDEQDIRWQQRYNLPITQVLDENGRIVGTGRYDGLSVEEARKAIAEDLRKMGLLTRTEKIRHRVLCHTERADCMTPIEFLVRKQWFIKSMEFKEQVYEKCREMVWVPEYMLQRLADWVNSIEWDWVISRERAFGTPIPFWYCLDCGFVICPDEDKLPVDPRKDPPPVSRCPACGSTRIEGVKYVCDCWVDSSITPLIVTGYFTDRKMFEKIYPAAIRQQGHDIIRTWLYYTVLRCLLETGEKPFQGVLINGHILGPDGLKMSKSRGNVVMPEEGLSKYGADAMRQALLSLTLGSDFPFKWEVVRYGKSFLQKVWSSTRFVYPFLKDYNMVDINVEDLNILDKWILAKLRHALREVTEAYDKYDFHIAIDRIQRFYWLDFCDQYIEGVKHRLYMPSNEASRKAALYTLYKVLWVSMRMLAPICPHITEEIYHLLFRKHNQELSIHGVRWPSLDEIPEIGVEDEKVGEALVKAIAAIRAEKVRKRIALSREVKKVKIKGAKEVIEAVKGFVDEVRKILHIKVIEAEEAENIAVEIEE